VNNKEKHVYYFGGEKAEGDRTMKDILGGKGANLAEMRNLGVPVPPGFTISTKVCEHYIENDETYPKGVKEAVEENLELLEKEMNMELGNSDEPLLLSVRSGAAQSMPGMMDTILNLGLNDEVVEKFSKATGNPRFVWDAYRRLIQMFSNVAHGIDSDEFERVITYFKKKKKVSLISSFQLTTLRQ